MKEHAKYDSPDASNLTLVSSWCEDATVVVRIDG